MSATCTHSGADAAAHPECAGCRQLLMIESPPLLDRDPTPEDFEAERDLPRPGVWAGEHGADLRRLTQDETDALIRAELYWKHALPAERERVYAAIGAPPQGPAGLRLDARDARGQRPWLECQRGGIDSDPLVRVLARRAWGDRDRQWFELRGVRKGEAVRTVSIPGPAPRSGSSVVLAWPNERSFGVAQYDAAPGERVHVSDNTGVGSFCVSDRLREPPIRNVVGRVECTIDAEAFIYEGAGADPERAARFAEHAAGVLAPSAETLATAERLLDRLYWTGDPPSAMPMSAGMAERIRTELAVKRADDAVGLSHDAGARRPGHKPAPPVPRWAKKRRERAMRGGR